MRAQFVSSSFVSSSRWWCCLVCLALFSTVLLAGMPQTTGPASNVQELPDELGPRTIGEPILWLSSRHISEAVETGQNDDLPGSVRDRMVDYLEQPKSADYRVDGCVVDFFEASNFVGYPEDLRQLASQANKIFKGIVVQKLQGVFHESRYGYLYLVRLLTKQKDLGVSMPREVIFFQSGGRMEIAGVEICVRAQGFPDLPEVGDHVTLFSDELDGTAVLQPLHDGLLFRRGTDPTVRGASRWAADDGRRARFVAWEGL